MKIKPINVKFLSLFLCIFALSISCKPKIAIKVNNREEIFVDVNIVPTESAKKIIRSFSKISSDESIFEGKEENIEKFSMDNGVKITKFKNTSSLEVSLSMQFPSTNLTPSIFSVNKKEGSLKFSLDRDKLKVFVENMKDEDKAYLELLMAPSLQGTDTSEREYASLIASAYGNKVANELLSSYIDLVFEMPTTIKTVNTQPNIKYEIKGKKAFINIPITKVLLMNEPILITVNYK
jgi:hypothetical protein